MTGSLAIDWRTVQARLGVTPDGIAGPVTFTGVFQYMGARSAVASAMGLTARDAFGAAGISLSCLRLAHFLGQVAHESGGFVHMREIWGPTTSQRRYERDFSKPWPSSPEEARTPRFAANRLAFTLGNSEEGDGKRYMGRGPIQITGRTNYAIFGGRLRLPLIARPEMVADPSVGLRAAAAFWHDRGLNSRADRDDVRAVTRRINGGQNGLADRIARTARAARLLE